MITLLEILALATLGGLSVMFLRRRIRRGSALALVFASLCTAMMLPPQASATELRKGDRVSIGKDEVIHSDLYVAGGQIRIAGTIEGDLVVAGGDVEVSGTVKGDMISASGQVRMTGQVDGSIRGYAGNITVKGKVGRNVMTCGGDVNIDRDATIGGSITSMSGRLSIDGHVQRDVLAMGGQANISGIIGGSAKIRSDELNIDSTAQIAGPVNFEGNKPAHVDEGAKLASPVHFEKITHGPDYGSVHYYLWRAIWTAAFILFGMVLVLLMPQFAEETMHSAEMYGAPIGLGVLVFFGVPIAAIIACLTVVGIPLAVLTVGFWFLMLCCAELVVGNVVGNWILGASRDTWGLIGRMALGFVIVRIVYSLAAQIHVLGLLAALGIWMWGMGAISLTIYKRLAPKVMGVPAAPMTQPLPPNTTIGPLPA